MPTTDTADQHHSAPGAATARSRRPTRRPVAPSRAPRRGADVDEVALAEESFWGRRQRRNAAATLAHCEEWMERLGWLENFDRVARGETVEERGGWVFSDSEVYKLLEALAWEQARTGDDRVEAMHRRLVERIAGAQDDDGYLSTAFGHPGLPPRYSDLSMGHELYCMGHLIQAGVARLRMVGAHDSLVGIAVRAADHICREFGEETDGSRAGIGGHPEIEVALMELSRALDDRRYRAQALVFLERRGRGTLQVPPLLAADYFQDDVPVREAAALRGHAVRALYLTAGAVDAAADSGDEQLLAALRGQWRRTVERRTYITGGMGSRHQDEGFGEDFELPCDRAYCETCAGVAAIMVAWRMYLTTGEVEHVDLIERVLHNIVAASAGADGRSFFYANPLQQRSASDGAESDGVHMRAEGGLRAPWFDVSCCPTNVARTLASLQTLAVSVEEAETPVVSVLQHMSGSARVQLPDGELALDISGDCPQDDQVVVTVREAPETPVRLRLRVPQWSRESRLEAPDGRRSVVEPGWVDVDGVRSAGDRIVLRLDTAPRLSWPDPRIDAVRGAVAVERGPQVLCLESPDLPADAALDDVRLCADESPRPLGGDEAEARLVVRRVAASPTLRPAFGPRTEEPGEGRRVTARLIPYHRWAERGPSTMRVFLPVDGG